MACIEQHWVNNGHTHLIRGGNQSTLGTPGHFCILSAEHTVLGHFIFITTTFLSTFCFFRSQDSFTPYINGGSMVGRGRNTGSFCFAFKKTQKLDCTFQLETFLLKYAKVVVNQLYISCRVSCRSGDSAIACVRAEKKKSVRIWSKSFRTPMGVFFIPERSKSSFCSCFTARQSMLNKDQISLIGVG